MQHGRADRAPRSQRGKEFTCTVLGTTFITERFLRVHVGGPELLQAIGQHPTMWARFRFGHSRRQPQRAYTIINPDPSEGTFDVDVHLHERATARWAQSANHGELIDATLQDSGFAAPRASAAHVHLVGDAASVPAMRTILDAFPHLRATLWLEQQHESEQDIPLHLRPSDEVVRIPRGDGTQLTAAVQAGLTQSHAQGRLETAWFWLACEATANRALLVHLRGELGIPRSSIAAMAYWKAT